MPTRIMWSIAVAGPSAYAVAVAFSVFAAVLLTDDQKVARAFTIHRPSLKNASAASLSMLVSGS